MKLSPLSIKKQEFNRGIRGYDQLEVSAYLEKLAVISPIVEPTPWAPTVTQASGEPL